METVYVKAYEQGEEWLAVPLETVIVLFVFKCIQNQHSEITFVLENMTNNTSFQFCKSVLKNFNTSFKEEVPYEVQNCVLPAVCRQGVGIYVAGLCAVLRRLLKKSSKRDLCDRLLGFRGGCLMACSEVSVWTKFCEIDLPKTTKEICSSCNQGEQDLMNLLTDVMRLEAHLQQPVRVHNIAKRRQDLAKANKKRTEMCTSQLEDYSLVEGFDEVNLPYNSTKTSRSSDENMCGMIPEDLSKQKYTTVPQWMHHCPLCPALENKRKTEDWSLEELIKHIAVLNTCESLHDFSTDSTVNCEQLPQLCHLFAEGSDMTLADMVLFPCIHHTLLACKDHLASLQASIPLVLQWYLRMARDHNTALAVEDFLHQTTVCEIKNSLSKHVGCINNCGLSITTSGNSEPLCQLVKVDAGVPGSKVNQLLDFTFLDDKDNKMQAELVYSTTIPQTIPVESLYIRDPKRYRPQSRMFTKQTDISNVLAVIQNSGIQPLYEAHPCDSVALDWKSLPEIVHPSSGELPSSRVQRKCQQVESLVTAILKIAKPGDVIVDFCSGGGHVGIVLAYLLQHCQIVMIDNKEDSLGRAYQRVQELGLLNVVFYQGNLDYFCGKFNIGTTLHACGVATDLVLQRCIDQQAAFVVCPCCYGAVQKTHLISYPRSTVFSSLKTLSYSDYLTLGHAADQNHVNNPKESQGKTCMGLIDTDRLLQAEERGYAGRLCTLVPESCSPKHNLLIGIPSKTTWSKALL